MLPWTEGLQAGSASGPGPDGAPAHLSRGARSASEGPKEASPRRIEPGGIMPVLPAGPPAPDRPPPAAAAARDALLSRRRPLFTGGEAAREELLDKTRLSTAAPAGSREHRPEERGAMGKKEDR